MMHSFGFFDFLWNRYSQAIPVILLSYFGFVFFMICILLLPNCRSQDHWGHYFWGFHVVNERGEPIGFFASYLRNYAYYIPYVGNLLFVVCAAQLASGSEQHQADIVMKHKVVLKK